MANPSALNVQDHSYRALHRDLALLLALGVCVIGVFSFTKAVAAKERQLEANIAATFYRNGERQLSAGEIERAIESFRTATTDDPDNRTYVLALADALATGNHTAEAQQALRRLRESDPGNAEINLHLARLAAKAGDTRNAVQYYENALYGLWTGTNVDERRRQARLELISFLIAEHQADRALSELLILNTEGPATAATHMETATLFLQLNDAQHALQHFREAIQLDHRNVAALTGAGEASFQLRGYATSRRYLEAAVKYDGKSERAMQLLQLVRLVLSNDPLAPHLSAEQRQRRLVADFSRSFERLQKCLDQQGGQNSQLQALRAEGLQTQAKLRGRNLLQTPGFITTALGVVYRMETATDETCKNATTADQALLLIAREHQEGSQ